MSGSIVSTHHGRNGIVLAYCDFFTWREAVLQAHDFASRYTTAGKPRVFWSLDRWVVKYQYRPVAVNA
jgi:hypothetical protein